WGIENWKKVNLLAEGTVQGTRYRVQGPTNWNLRSDFCFLLSANCQLLLATVCRLSAQSFSLSLGHSIPMKNIKNSLFYIIVTGGFTALMYFIITKGKLLETGRNVVAPVAKGNHWTQFLEGFVHNLKHPLAILLAQIVTIIFVARLFGWLFRKIGQPSVIGEIIAGIVLGPSLLGMYFPGFKDALFPLESIGNLQFLSQIGLILFRFVIGMELDLGVLKNKANDAVVISHASIVIPFTLGVLL